MTMKHIKASSRIVSAPAQASLIETQQKVAVFGAFAAALGTFGETIGIFLGLQQDQAN
jgi:hypothetical protein